MTENVVKRPGRSLTTRLVASAAILLLGTVSAVTIGSGATFTSARATNDVGQNGGTAVTTGVLDLTLGAQGNNTNSVDVAASGLVPGDTIQRAIDVTNAGTVDFSGVTLASTASASNDLTDATTGLQMNIEECSVAWVKQAGWTYLCGPADAGTKTALTNFNNVDVVHSAASVVTAGGQTLNTAGATAHYRVTLTLPATYDGPAGSATSTTINYAFTATQRTATNK